jgi:hypothetical protein
MTNLLLNLLSFAIGFGFMAVVARLTFGVWWPTREQVRARWRR